ncbi:MAG TPA: hypothetical protein VLG50_05530 [Candidatus Saccharimonadales bacterium]|nr:hypothetical protein [Candidatus Saccharimonadales bacterium]
MKFCGGDDIVDYNLLLGEGTHGVVYGSLISPTIAVKLFNLKHCHDIKSGEYAMHEYVHDQFEKFKNHIDKNLVDYVFVPQVYGFKYLPNSQNPSCCMYYMDQLKPLYNHIIQLSFNYPRDANMILSSGQYVGIDTLKSFGFNNQDVSMINRSIASMMALFHYAMKIDAYDIEYVLARHGHAHGVYAIDYDKVNVYQNDTTIVRKLTENDTETRVIKNELDLSRLLSTSIHYCPHILYPEYQEWKWTYIDMAKKFKHEKLAQLVMEQYEKYF